MITSILRLSAAAAAVAMASVAWADERAAFLIGNEVNRNIGPAPDSALVLNLASAFGGNGFTVNGGRDVPRAVLLNDLAQFIRNADGADRVAIVLSGHFVRSGGTGWFLPADSDVPELATLPATGIPVSLFLDLAARAPGGAIVALAQSARDPRVGAGIRPGSGALDVPQGVTVITGPARELTAFLGNNVLQPGAMLSDLVASTGPDIRIRGFVSKTDAFVPVDTAQAGAETRPDADERAYWRIVQDINTIEAYEAYLEAYSGGLFSRQAEQRIKAIRSAPERRAKDAETAIGLDREARRQVQRDLSILGFDPRGIDGIFGPGTRGAIAAWQTERGFPATGYLGPRQLEVLRNTAQRRADDLAAEARRKEEELRAQDVAYWRQTGKKGGEANFRLYLQRYPDGQFADTARKQLEAITAKKRAKLEAAERRAWDAAVATDTIEGYRDYMRAYPRGIFEAEAGARIQELEEKARNRVMIDAARKEENQLGLAPVTLLLAERRLAALGMEPGAVDGKLDKDARRAIRRFQRAAGLPVTGFLSRATVVRLIAS